MGQLKNVVVERDDLQTEVESLRSENSALHGKLKGKEARIAELENLVILLERNLEKKVKT